MAVRKPKEKKILDNILSPKQRRKYAGVAVILLLLFLMRNKVSIIGYTVMNEMTKTIVASYILILSLVLIVVAYKLLHKE